MRRGPSWAGFLGWMVGGAVLCLATLSLNLFAAVPMVIIVILTIVRPALFTSAFGLLSGVGVIALYVAFLQYLNLWPWLIAGLVLVVAGVVAHSNRMRGTGPPSSASTPG